MCTAFECARKVTLVGLLVFFGEGSTVQLTLGLIICVLCIMLYNNYKPYDAWQNDVLQQAAQVTIFLTLVSHLVTQATSAPDAHEVDAAFNKQIIGDILIGITFMSSLIAVPVSILEVYPDPWKTLVDTRRRVHAARKRLGLGSRKSTPMMSDRSELVGSARDSHAGAPASTGALVSDNL